MSSLQNAIILLLLVFIGVMLYLLYVKKSKTGDKVVQAPLPPPPQVIEKTVEVQPIIIESPYEVPYVYNYGYDYGYPYWIGGNWNRRVRPRPPFPGPSPHPRPPRPGPSPHPIPLPGGGVRPGISPRPSISPRPGGRR